MTKIVQLTSQNVKRLKAVEITPDGNVVVVGGRNGAGKTSVLDSIMYALGGKAVIPEQAMRTGAKKAKVELKLDDMIVERKWTSSGSTLEVRKSGTKVASPQTILDQLCAKIAFDPMEFCRLEPNKQAETLRSLVGLDFTELDAKRKDLYDKRTQVNRDGKQLKAQLDAMPHHADAPQQPIVIAQLLAEAEKRRQFNNDNQEQKLRAVKARECARQDVQALESAERSLEAAKQALAAAQIDYDRAKESASASNKMADELEDKAASLEDQDVAEVEREIATAESRNKMIDDNLRYEAAENELDELRKKSQALSEAIAEADEKKTSLLSEATWPVPGLGFDEDGVTFKELPFGNASAAEKTRVSVAMGVALNPGLPVFLIRDGSLLDEDNMQLLATLAKEHDAQFWIERVGEGDECTVIIEDGEVKDAS